MPDLKDLQLIVDSEGGELPDPSAVARHLARCLMNQKKPLPWTTDAPTEAGWYWLWDGKKSFPARIVEVFEYAPGILEGREGVVPVDRGTIVLYTDTRSNAMAMDENAHWAGPIPLPVEVSDAE